MGWASFLAHIRDREDAAREKKREFDLQEEDRKSRVKIAEGQLQESKNFHQEELGRQIATLGSQNYQAEENRKLRADELEFRATEYAGKLEEAKRTKKDAVSKDRQDFYNKSNELLKSIYEDHRNEADKIAQQEKGIVDLAGQMAPQVGDQLLQAHKSTKTERMRRLREDALQRAKLHFMAYPQYANDPEISKYRNEVLKQLSLPGLSDIETAPQGQANVYSAGTPGAQ